MPTGSDSDRLARAAREAEAEAAAAQAFARLARERVARVGGPGAAALKRSASAHDEDARRLGERADSKRSAALRARRAERGWSAVAMLAREPGRLRAVLRLGEDDADPTLDRLARLASRLLGTPVALVSLVGREDQAFVGQVGLPEDSPFARGTPLSHSFCQVAVAAREPVSTADARRDPRFSGNPAIRDLGVIAYAGWPLLTTAGDALGALCAIDSSPREWSPGDLEILHDLADAAVAELEARAARLIAEHALRREHHIATTLQYSLLPDALPLVPGLSIAARYLPAENVIGGDWYDVFRLPNDRIGIAVGDVVGHGIEAAATAGRLRNALRGAVLERSDPGSVLGRLNDIAHAYSPAAWGSVVFGILDLSACAWTWARAGHPPSVLRATDTVLEPGPKGSLLGVPAPGSDYAVSARPLEPASTVIIYTDGLVERRGSSLDARLEELRARVQAGPADPEPLCDELVTAMLAVPAADDVAIVAFRLGE